MRAPLRTTLVVLVAVLTALALGGCGDEDEPERDSADTSEQAAEAFVRHFFDTTNHAMATGDTDELHSLADPVCKSCTGGAEWIESVYDAHGTLEGGLYEVVEATTRLTGAPDHETLVDLRLDAGRRVVTGTGTDLDGEFAGGPTEMEVTVVHRDGEWSVVQWAMG